MDRAAENPEDPIRTPYSSWSTPCLSWNTGTQPSPSHCRRQRQPVLQLFPAHLLVWAQVCQGKTARETLNPRSHTWPPGRPIYCTSATCVSIMSCTSGWLWVRNDWTWWVPKLDGTRSLSKSRETIPGSVIYSHLKFSVDQAPRLCNLSNKSCDYCPCTREVMKYELELDLEEVGCWVKRSELSWVWERNSKWGAQPTLNFECQ